MENEEREYIYGSRKGNEEHCMSFSVSLLYSVMIKVIQGSMDQKCKLVCS